jgi:hypothetical protein
MGLIGVIPRSRPLSFTSFGAPDCSELRFVDLSPERVTDLMDRVREKVLSTKEGCAYLLDKTFADYKEDKKSKKQWYGPPPGTIYIFSMELASYYDGRGWRKIKI